MSNSDVILACQQLIEEGKAPSVALIKPLLQQSLPLPQIIAGLKSFKANPKQKVINAPNAPESKVTSSLEQKVEQLEAEVQQLKNIIQQLQA